MARDGGKAVAPLHDELWTRAGGRPVRALAAGPRVPATPEVVIVPGLGAIGYMLELLHACGAWSRTRLLDLPGFGSPRTASCSADLDSLGPVAADCLREPGGTGDPVVLVGHSTGAQLALRAAALAPDAVAALVLIGVTFVPSVREAPVRLVPQLRTYLWERPRELLVTVPDFVRAGRRLPRYIASALADRPEDQVAGVRAPVLVLRGKRDALCPPDWARTMADLGARSGHGEAVTLPGSHNVPYTHPGAVALHIARAARLAQRHG